MIHISMLRKMLAKAGQTPVNLRFWKANGEIVDAVNVVVTSSRFRPETVNLKFISSGEIRKAHVITIFEINDTEVFI